MDGFLKVSLKKLIENIGEDRVKAILSEFYCPLNSDIEIFLKSKAVEFEKQGISATQLIFASYKNDLVLVGYYTLSTKAFNISKSAISKTLSKRINKFATYSPELRAYILPAPLIAQLGKNYAGNHNKLLTGDELLAMAIDDIRLIQQLAGGKVVYIECEDKPKLTDFYSSNGFVTFGKRPLDKDETNLTGDYLVQMLKYLS